MILKIKARAEKENEEEMVQVEQVQMESLAPGGAPSWRDRLMANQEGKH